MSQKTRAGRQKRLRSSVVLCDESSDDEWFDTKQETNKCCSKHKRNLRNCKQSRRASNSPASNYDDDDDDNIMENNAKSVTNRSKRRYKTLIDVAPSTSSRVCDNSSQESAICVDASYSEDQNQDQERLGSGNSSVIDLVLSHIETHHVGHHIGTDIERLVNELLDSTNENGSDIQHKSTKDYVAETRKLLLESNDLVETVNKPELKKNTSTVVASDTQKPVNDKRLKAKIDSELEIIDLCSTPEKEVENSNKKESPQRKCLGECSICLEVLGHNGSIAATVCGHIFCEACVKNAVIANRRCPNCRKRLTVKQIHPLFV